MRRHIHKSNNQNGMRKQITRLAIITIAGAAALTLTNGWRAPAGQTALVGDDSLVAPQDAFVTGVKLHGRFTNQGSGTAGLAGDADETTAVTPAAPASSPLGTGGDVASRATHVQRLLAQATVQQTQETDPASDGTFVRRHLVDAGGKYPLVLVEETIRRNKTNGRERSLNASAMVADHIVIKLRPGITAADLQDLNETYGATIRRKLSADRTFLISFQEPDIDTLAAAMTDYRDQSEIVQYAEPDYLVFPTTTVPNDPRFPELWGMQNTLDTDIDAPEAWDRGTGNQNVVVGVIDTGIDYNHQDLAGNIWWNPGETPDNGIDDDGNGYVDDVHGWNFVGAGGDPMDDHYHGTHVSGTIGALGDNNVGVAGVAWNVRIAALKFLDASGRGYTSDAIEAVDYATDQAFTLTSNSWGGGGFSQGLKDAIDRAHAAGILFMAAAGNDYGRDNDQVPQYPSGFDCPNIIAVTATDQNDGLAYFANYGVTTVDVAAPGVDILSTIPGDSYTELSGTSMATPHVAGAAALIMAADPTMDHMAVRRSIFNSVDSIPAMAGRISTGGRLNLANEPNTEPENDPWDPGDDTGFGATVLNTPGTDEQTHGTHSLSPSDHYDWFAVDLAADAGYNFNSNGGTGDTLAELYSDREGTTRVAYDDDGGSGLMFSLDFTCTASGTYYLRVRTYRTGWDAQYGLNYSLTSPPPGAWDDWDPTDDVGTSATAIGPPSRNEQAHGPHTMSSIDHYDWFVVRLSAGLQYNFNSIGGEGDTYAELFADPHGNERVAYNDDSGGNLMFSLNYTPGTTADYYLRVRTYIVGWDAIYVLNFSGGGWNLAYGRMFEEPNQVETLRAFRDDILNDDPLGKTGTDLLYQQSEESLGLLMQHPELMARAGEVLTTNMDAVEAALAGEEAVIVDTQAVVDLLREVESLSDHPKLTQLARATRIIIEIKRATGQPFLGLRFEDHDASGEANTP
jgi:subtilisin family serine protease